jgi:hypothetical protein
MLAAPLTEIVAPPNRLSALSILVPPRPQGGGLTALREWSAMAVKVEASLHDQRP